MSNANQTRPEKIFRWLSHKTVEYYPTGIVVSVGALLGIPFFFWTWPVCLCLLASAAIWWYARQTGRVFGTVTASVFLPITVGFAALATVLFVLNASSYIVDPRWVRPVEEALLGLQITLRNFSDLSLWIMAPALLALVLLSYLFSISKLATKYAAFQKIATNALIALTAFTSSG